MGLIEGKGRKINKEKLKAVLVAIDCMEDEEMDEVNYDPCNIQHISSSINPGTSSVVNMPLLDFVAREDILSSEYDSDSLDSPLSAASHDSVCSNDKDELNNSIFSWDSYDSFVKFCGKIGINLHDMEEANKFLNTIRIQQSLPPVNLEAHGNLVELLGTLCL